MTKAVDRRARLVVIGGGAIGCSVEGGFEATQDRELPIGHFNGKPRPDERGLARLRRAGGGGGCRPAMMKEDES